MPVARWLVFRGGEGVAVPGVGFRALGSCMACAIDTAGSPSRPLSTNYLQTDMSLEKALQQDYGTSTRAENFYKKQMLDHLNPRMLEFVARIEMIFVATSNLAGDCDNSIRVGPPGFVKIIDAQRIAYPEYRGNGVFASLGNIAENPHIGILMIDFYGSTVGLHVNGQAAIVDELEDCDDPLAERWVVVDVQEAYIQCSKHIPLMARKDKKTAWDAEEAKRNAGDFFDVQGQQQCQDGRC